MEPMPQCIERDCNNVGHVYSTIVCWLSDMNGECGHCRPIKGLSIGLCTVCDAVVEYSGRSRAMLSDAVLSDAVLYVFT